ncbi:hypothetical protein [Amycolatopsis sp. NPDC059657]|uniref:hypothetical protein n=1 Tax=Amycolatopsis sp. NPDC059657 TaxID=3346899 RepID=UPI00366C5F83
MGRLRTTVHVTDDAGATHVFGPYSAVPDWATEKITNPKVWEVEPERGQASIITEPPPAPPADPVPAAAADEAVQQQPVGDGDQSPAAAPTEPLPEPPRSGKGSGADAWREYAMSTGWFDSVSEDANREEIIAAVDEQRAAIEAEKE